MLGVAAVLNLLIPGAGQMYKGRIAEGLVWLIFVAIGYILFIMPGIVLQLFCVARAWAGDSYMDEGVGK
jgi:TM2 domain-containing membrane protein YozV